MKRFFRASALALAFVVTLSFVPWVSAEPAEPEAPSSRLCQLSELLTAWLDHLLEILALEEPPPLPPPPVSSSSGTGGTGGGSTGPGHGGVIYPGG